ncbi:murein hydrolase activator EnvC family protein [Pseudoroseomonas globiformis]|uniref:Murein hydrolase activator EnvC family protein n=1 Tax=Teichococcus globiformis TaxID=2307229 RepID=A0ABV7G4J0_9PROT
MARLPCASRQALRRRLPLPVPAILVPGLMLAALSAGTGMGWESWGHRQNKLLSGLMSAARAAEPTPRSVREAEAAARTAQEAAETAALAAREAAEAEGKLAEQRAAAGRRAVAADEAAAAAGEAAREAAEVRDAALVDLGRRAQAMAPLLPLLRRLSSWPSETLLAVPGDPETALRGTLVLRSLTRHLSAEAEALRQAQAVAAEATRKAEAEATQLAEARAEVRAAAAAVEAALADARARRGAAEREQREAAAEAATSAARATDLRDVLERLEAARQKAERDAAARAAREQAAAEQAQRRRAEAEAEALATRRRAAQDAEERARLAREEAVLQRQEQARQRRAEQESRQASRAPAVSVPRGGRTVPVAGRVSRDFGDAGAGGAAQGITYSAPAGARVVSPCGGRIAFAAPFRSYGRMVIIDCGGGHHAVLAGMESLDADAGSRVLAGEPVGRLGGDGDATLYIELRRNGTPVDPKPWLRARG